MRGGPQHYPWSPWGNGGTAGLSQLCNAMLFLSYLSSPYRGSFTTICPPPTEGVSPLFILPLQGELDGGIRVGNID